MTEPLLPTRRALLAAAAALPIASRLRAQAPRPGEALQAMIAAQVGPAGGTVVIPADPQPLFVGGAVLVPPNVDLVIRRDLAGTPASTLLLSGNTNVRFENARLLNVSLHILSGSLAISGLDYSGAGHLAAILIAGPGPYRDLRIENFRIANANYGILRQGAQSVLAGATISNGVFRQLAGDAIEWNVCPNDAGVVIEDQDIAGIDAPAGKAFWGIGIGFAGGHYTPDWNRASAVKGFTIRRITGRALRQLIHVEAGRDFTVEQIRGTDISPGYSATSGIELASVACYACSDFTIDDVTADAPILLASGTLQGRFIAPCANATVSGIRLARGDLRADLGGPRSRAIFRDITLSAGSLTLRGSTQRLDLSDIDVTSVGGAAPFTENPGFLSGSLASFRPQATTGTRSGLRLRRGG